MSRPKIKPKSRRKTLAVTLPPLLISKAKAFAELGGVSVSSMVEVSLSDFLDKADSKLKETIANRIPWPNA